MHIPSAAGHNVRNIEYLKRAADIVKQDEIHHQHNGRYLNVFEHLPCARSVDSGRLLDILGKGLERRHEQDHVIAGETP